MADNFFTDNLDLQYHLGRLDLSETVEMLEEGYRFSAEYDAAPRNYADAMDNYRLILTVVGDI
ncbi:MAG: acyl-CoA dehydrogenase, partial [Armatimonadetes bacterium]|nr:acyl-CoA dehydrogenase [Armatimonadota bacterium]